MDNERMNNKNTQGSVSNRICTIRCFEDNFEFFCSQQSQKGKENVEISKNSIMPVGKEQFRSIVSDNINGWTKTNRGKLIKKKSLVISVFGLMYFLAPIKRFDDRAVTAGTTNANPINVALTCAVVE
jgi:hypothetical protein